MYIRWPTVTLVQKKALKWRTSGHACDAIDKNLYLDIVAFDQAAILQPDFDR